MIRDTEWREELHNDPVLRSFVKVHEDAFDKIFREWAYSHLEHFEKHRNLGVLSVEHIFQQLQQPGSITIYKYKEAEDIAPYLQEAAFRTDADQRLYLRYYAEFYQDYKRAGELTNYNLSYLARYMTEMAEEFTYHYIKLMRGAEKSGLGTTLPKHASIFNTNISSLTPSESTPDRKEQIKAVVRLVGRFQAKVTTQPEPFR